jgi:hypothetical protein
VTAGAAGRDSTGSAAGCDRRPRATAFGLDIACDVPLPFLDGAAAAPTGRVLALSVSDGDATQLGWPSSAEPVCSASGPGGEVIYRIERHAELGYLIAGRAYGAHLLSSDGRTLRCCPEDRPANAWQRLLIAQVLPFAALLQGLEVFHSSAIVSGGRGFAFLGHSGAGKTSIALELCSRGANFLADDVLALEVGGAGLMAHPGTPLASVEETEIMRMHADAGLTPERILEVDSTERLVGVAGAREPAPLAGLFFLDRRGCGPGPPRFEPAADAQTLLSSTFNFALVTPERLRGLLDVCALASQLRVERIAYGAAVSIAQLGAAMEQRLSALR